MEDNKSITIPLQMFEKLIEESTKCKAIECILKSNEFLNKKEIAYILNVDTKETEVNDVF